MASKNKHQSPPGSYYLNTDPYDDNDHFFGNDESIKI